MLNDDTRKKLKDIVRGAILPGQEDSCSTIRNLLAGSFSTGTTVKANFESNAVVKEEQARFLTAYATANNQWATDLPDASLYLDEGFESQVYLDTDNRSVLKLNDAVYYATWLEFFNSLIIHNLIFVDTAYSFLGFTTANGGLQAVLRQPYVKSDKTVDLSDVLKWLPFNGFENKKRNDYYNKELGLILEDIHDENVLVHADTLFFIDTVFYTVDPSTYNG